jgi:hypothetical protein
VEVCNRPTEHGLLAQKNNNEACAMRYATAMLAVLVAAITLDAETAAPIDVPGAKTLQVAIKSTAQRDLLAREDATAFVLGGLVRVQAGDRARSKTFTSTESARCPDWVLLCRITGHLSAGNKVYALNMIWKLPGLNVTFQGYNGGARNANGSLLIEADAITRERDQQEKSRQEQKQKL